MKIFSPTAAGSRQLGLPGGKFDWLKPIERAMRREILEELSIQLAANAASLPIETECSDSRGCENAAIPAQ